MSKPSSFYSPELIKLAKNLRKNSTLSEMLLWEKLKGRQVQGYKFKRQAPLLNYVVSFYCKGLKLIIEVGGLSHDDKMESDATRYKSLEDIGISILRFSDLEIKNNIQNVLQKIDLWIEANSRLPH